jgi:hypothetical protein
MPAEALTERRNGRKEIIGDSMGNKIPQTVPLWKKVQNRK